MAGGQQGGGQRLGKSGPATPAQEVFFGTDPAGGGVEAGLVAGPGPLRALKRCSMFALSTMIF